MDTISKLPIIKVAFGSVPKDSGTFTFYRNLRPALQPYGIDLRCVTIGKREAALIEAPYVDGGCTLLAPNSDSVKQQAQAFAQWCEQEAIDIVMAINSVAMLSALPYLPKRIRVLSRCANGFEEGYRVTLSGQERLMKIVALTPKLKDDLVKKYGVDPSHVCLIPNGIEPGAFEKAADSRKLTPASEPIQLGFVGRLEHRQKGVLYLPKIVRSLKQQNVSFHLKIAGKGIHREQLESELRPFIKSGEVTLVGALTKHQIPDFLHSIDAFLFTSHFEGCPNALLEAMMAGCVPVAFSIEGITDFLIDPEHTGFIAPMAESDAFAAYVARLANNPALRQQLSEATAAAAYQRFTSDVAAKCYGDLFAATMRSPLPDFEPLPWDRFEVDPVYKKRWTAHIPQPIKAIAKRVINRSVSVA